MGFSAPAWVATSFALDIPGKALRFFQSIDEEGASKGATHPMELSVPCAAGLGCFSRITTGYERLLENSTTHP
jgi:hypothetical protein